MDGGVLQTPGNPIQPGSETHQSLDVKVDRDGAVCAMVVVSGAMQYTWRRVGYAGSYTPMPPMPAGSPQHRLTTQGLSLSLQGLNELMVEFWHAQQSANPTFAGKGIDDTVSKYKEMSDESKLASGPQIVCIYEYVSNAVSPINPGDGSIGEAQIKSGPAFEMSAGAKA